MTPADFSVPAADEPDEFGTPPMVAVEAPPAQDTKPGRPTTRAGRAAARKARSAASASGSDAKPKATKPAPRKASLESRLAGSLASLGGMVMAGGAVAGSAPLQADGLVIIQHSANMAEAINRVADQDPRVKAALEKMLTAGVWSGVAAVMLPVGLAIAGNHGMVPPGLAEVFGAKAAPPAEPQAA